MNIFFLDCAAYRAYNANTLRSEALGGSEATLIRVAKGLAAAGLDVSVFQQIDGQREAAVIDGIRHVGVNSAFPTPDVVVHFRSGANIPLWRDMFPSARHIMWTQDFFTVDACAGLNNEEIICLSDAHIQQVKETMKRVGYEAKAIHKIHNPVEIDGHKLDKVPGRLGFFSSPHKGWSQVWAIFNELVDRQPGLSLAVANPGYVGGVKIRTNSELVNLGELSHPHVLEEMSKCEVLFYPQTVFPETFGIVLAEANAMGVPVLCHDFGAAGEVLCDAEGPNVGCNAVIDVSTEDVGKTLKHLLERKKKPVLDPRFKPETIIVKWKELLGC